METKQLIEAVWQEKYKCKDEHTTWDSIYRICDAVSPNDPHTLKAIALLDFIPGGRIWAGAGSGNRTSLLNCYVSPDIDDSLDGIMDSLKAAALTMQQGGGIGMDFSTLRPRGARVHRSNSISSGVIPFMSMWNSMCATIMSAGTRRGAMMAVLSDSHPDILEFINCKNTANSLTNFNISVLVTDAFMDCVKEDGLWTLHHSHNDWIKVRAKFLWNIILENTYHHSEPGVIFIDRINQLNNLWYCENIHGTNPCGEQPLPANGNCNLGAVNLANMVREPFTRTAFIDHAKLQNTVATGVRFLDNVLDVTNYPLEEQRQEALAKRRLGLGVMGLGTMLQMVGIRYGSPEAVGLTGRLLEEIARMAYATSIELAKERGPFPAWDLEAGFSDAKPFVAKLGLATTPRRNSHLLTIAPTGTTSLLAGNVTSGIEPSFAWQYERKMLMASGELKAFKVEDYGYSLYRSLHPSGKLPDYMCVAGDISVSEHIAMQAAAQQWVDSAVSKTVNCPANISFDDFKHVYEEAYKLGCKGCTTYRPSESRGSVLSELPKVCNIDGSCSDEA